jgi:hypothetical protein
LTGVVFVFLYIFLKYFYLKNIKFIFYLVFLIDIKNFKKKLRKKMLSPGNFSFSSVQATKDSDIQLVSRKLSPEVVGSISVRRNYFLNHFLKKKQDLPQ